MATNEALSKAFKEFTDELVERVKKVNAAGLRLQEKINPQSRIIQLDSTSSPLGDTRFKGDGVAIREYEDALEELKRFIENRGCDQQHNRNLKRRVEDGGVLGRHAIRALEVELVHPVMQGQTPFMLSQPESGVQIVQVEPREEGGPIAEHTIIAVKVRGLISVDPADGNEQPNYSSKSSSSMVT